MQDSSCQGVSLGVRSYFVFPEFGAGLGNPKVRAAGMSVPKATVNKHNRVMTRQYKIRPTGQIPAMQAKTETARMQE